MGRSACGGPACRQLLPAPRAGVKPLLLKILFQNQAEGVPLPTSPLLAGSGICLIAELGGAG